jgi:TRAP-type C4-dicarboxylate transport system permease small subunit
MKRLFTTVVEVSVKALEAAMTVLLIIMMGTMFWQVFTRFVVKVPSIWTEELARAAFVYMAILGAAVGVRRFSHFSLTLLSDRLHGTKRNRYFRFVLNGSIFIGSVLICFIGFDFTMKFGFTRVSPTFLVPMAWLFASLPIGGFFMAIFSFYNILFEDYSSDPELF